MKITCPRCSGIVQLNQPFCSQCGFSLTLRSVLKWGWQQLKHRTEQATMVRCAYCKRAIPIKSEVCPQCKRPLTVGSAVDSVAKPARRKFWAFVRKAEKKPSIRYPYFLAYLFLSVIALLFVLAMVNEKSEGELILHTVLSACFLTAIALLILVTIPRHVLQTLARQLNWMLKLALAANYLTGMLLMRIFTATWTEQALILLGTLASTWGAAFLLVKFIWPMKENVTNLYTDNSKKPRWHDPTRPQGRRARFD